MRSDKPKVIEVTKLIGQGELPGFIPLAHRHFQKALPHVSNNKKVTLTVATDLLDMVVPERILNQISSVEIEYEKQ
jgi:hypothetical protein